MTILARLEEGRLLAPIDRLLAEAAQRDGGADDAVAAALAWASASARAGHVCVDLATPPLALERDGSEGSSLAWPTLDEWRARLGASRLVSDGTQPTPLVLRRDGRLYLQRLWQQETEVAERIAALASVRPARPPLPQDRLQAYFPEDALDQRRAAEVAHQTSLTLLCGGPGTGKTTTVCRLIALQIEAALLAHQRPPRVRLLAPTGKAAARLAESVTRSRASQLIPDDVRRYIPTEAQTLHRALGLRGDGSPPRFGSERPLPVDLLIVDEASMIDLEAMALVLRALPDGAQLVLLGDRHQLASVEAGAVLAELSQAPGLSHCLVELTHSRRFDPEGAIARLARAIVAGDATGALEVLRSSSQAQLERPRRGKQSDLLEQATAGYRRALAASTPTDALVALGDFRVLCAHRRGSRGATGLNRRIERALLAEGRVRQVGDVVIGRPILVTSNDYTLDLHNGDVGILWQRSDGTRACFSSDDGARLRELAPSRLPPHEPVYAMTVHKSQGSEWKRIVVVLPEDPSPVLTRELLYTAVTRAGEQLSIVGSAALVTRAIETPTRRLSSLGERIGGIRSA